MSLDVRPTLPTPQPKRPRPRHHGPGDPRARLARFERVITDGTDAAALTVFGPFGALYDQFAFYLTVIRKMPRGLHYRLEILNQIADITVGAGAVLVGGGMLFVVVGISFATGVAVGIQGYAGLQQIGAQVFTGIVSAIGNTREITPLVAGVALACQVGAGFTAQIGAMRISDEVDALEVMSVDSVVFLVTTRVWAALLTMIPLYLAALFASYLATRIMVTQFFGLGIGVYNHYFTQFLPITDVIYSFIKAIVFAVAVTMIHCFYGYYATGGPAGVGRAAGRAIRLSVITVVLLNLILSIMFWGNKDTARIVGSVVGVHW